MVNVCEMSRFSGGFPNEVHVRCWKIHFNSIQEDSTSKASAEVRSSLVC